MERMEQRRFAAVAALTIAPLIALVAVVGASGGPTAHPKATNPPRERASTTTAGATTVRRRATTTTRPTPAPPHDPAHDPAHDFTPSLVTTIRGDISPKSVSPTGTGLVFAQNMMYRHTVTVYDGAGTLVKTIPDGVTLSAFGLAGHPGTSRGAPVEAAVDPRPPRHVHHATTRCTAPISGQKVPTIAAVRVA